MNTTKRLLRNGVLAKCALVVGALVLVTVGVLNAATANTCVSSGGEWAELELIKLEVNGRENSNLSRYADYSARAVPRTEVIFHIFSSDDANWSFETYERGGGDE